MNTEELRVEEYKSLRGEIYSLVEETRKLEVLAIGGVAAIYSWFVTESVEPGAAWYLPGLLPLLGGFRSYVLFQRINEIAGYLRGVESSLRWEGWETYFQSKAQSRVSSTAVVIWAVLLAATLIAPYALPCCLEDQDVLPPAIGTAVLEVLEVHRAAVEKGAIVSVDETTSRVRILPIQRQAVERGDSADDTSRRR